MYEWVKGNAYNLNVTLYNTNITLNSATASYFNDIRWVMVGIDAHGKKVAIKPVAKKMIDLNLVPLEQLHKISIGKGYGRISNKSIMLEIKQLLERDIEGLKFQASYNDQEDFLEVDLSSPL
ncbi:MAG: hypothetical protein EOM50_05875 [Erysipelotrichia bacterium]|nr:hypothetical protein [Erysipelotrichia bacterium]NCC54239.1 hypothetical protein [Erysipelotrichia bacterium]